MQMDRVGHGGVVDESHDALTALFDNEGRAGRHAVVADQGSRTLSRVDLLGELVDIDLIVVNWLSRDWVGDCPGLRVRIFGFICQRVKKPSSHSHLGALHGRNGHGELVQPSVWCTLPILSLLESMSAFAGWLPSRVEAKGSREECGQGEGTGQKTSHGRRGGRWMRESLTKLW